MFVDMAAKQTRLGSANISWAAFTSKNMVGEISTCTVSTSGCKTVDSGKRKEETSLGLLMRERRPMACLSKSKGWSPVAAYVYTLSWSDLQTTTEEADVEVFQPASARLILGMLLDLFFLLLNNTWYQVSRIHERQSWPPP